MSRKQNPRPPKRGGGAITALLVIILLILIGLCGLMIYMCTTVVNQGNVPGTARPSPSEEPQQQLQQESLPPETTETLPPETTMPDPEHVVSTATVAVTGDLLMHAPIYQSQ